MATPARSMAVDEQELVVNASVNVFILISPLELEFRVSARPVHALAPQIHNYVVIVFDVDF